MIGVSGWQCWKPSRNFLPPLEKKLTASSFRGEVNDYKANRPEPLTSRNYSHGYCGEAAAAI